MSASQGLDRGLTNYGDRDFARYLRRSMARSMGLSTELLASPSSASRSRRASFNNCHRLMPELAEAVARGVLAAGGLPRAFPTISLGEVFLNPTSMMFRNLMSMDVEEMIRAQPMDAVVLIGGCDKTVPAQLMGAASAGSSRDPARHRPDDDRPPSRRAARRVHRLPRASGRSSARARSTTRRSSASKARLAVTAGTCAVMGTASTMACIAEALGMALPGTAAIPAVDSQRLVAAEETGKAAVRLAHQPILPSQIITHAVGRERVPGADGARRLDQRGRSSHRHRRPRSASASRPSASTRSPTRRRCSST